MNGACGHAADKPVIAGMLTVTTIDGRTVRGAVDAASNDQALWLRREEGGVVLTAPAAWDSIVAVQGKEREIAVAELKEAYMQLATAAPVGFLTEFEVAPASDEGLPFSSTGSADWPRSRRVRYLEIVYAGLANRDRDVEPDGLEIAIAAFGDGGAPLPVRGTMRAELFGERRPADRPGGASFDAIGRWSQRTRAEDFVDGVAIYWLPFRAVAPEWEFDLMPDAVLNVELSVVGHGNYSASAPVVIRSFNPLRDDLQLQRGTRFLPSEAHGAPSPSDQGWRAGRWFHWTW